MFCVPSPPPFLLLPPPLFSPPFLFWHLSLWKSCGFRFVRVKFLLTCSERHSLSPYDCSLCLLINFYPFFHGHSRIFQWGSSCNFKLDLENVWKVFISLTFCCCCCCFFLVGCYVRFYSLCKFWRISCQFRAHLWTWLSYQRKSKLPNEHPLEHCVKPWAIIGRFPSFPLQRGLTACRACAAIQHTVPVPVPLQFLHFQVWGSNPSRIKRPERLIFRSSRKCFQNPSKAIGSVYSPFKKSSIKAHRFCVLPLWKIIHQNPSILCTPPFENHPSKPTGFVYSPL